MESQILLQLQLPFQKGLSIHFSSIYVVTQLSSICGGGATGSDHVRMRNRYILYYYYCANRNYSAILATLQITSYVHSRNSS